MNIFKLILLSFLTISLLSCGGGSSSGSGILIEGLLTQGEEVEHSRANLRHSAGENIGEVSICALGECSVTDDQGLYGFLAPATFVGGEILFSINGHGIETTKVVTIPEGASDVYLHFEHSHNQVIIHHMMVDGERVDAEHLAHGHTAGHTVPEGEAHE
jgi:hypothetical protein